MKPVATIKNVKAKRRIVLVDDHPVVREGLKRAIESEPDLIVCGEYDSSRDALQGLKEVAPDLVIADLALNNSHGIDLIKDVRNQFPNIPVLVLSMYEEALYAPRVLRAGARGYLMKSQGPEVLIVAIRQVLNNNVYLSERMTRTMLHAVSNSNDGKLKLVQEVLSDRELQVFEYIGQGYGSSEIARALNVHVKTVSSHRENIKSKLNVRTGHELSRQAIQWAQTKELGA